jgi:hypothetical protein
MARGQMRKEDSLIVVGVGTLSVVLWVGLLYAGSWVLVHWIGANRTAAATAIYWFVATVWLFGTMPQLLPKIRKSWPNATVPGSLAEDAASRQLGHDQAKSASMSIDSEAEEVARTLAWADDIVTRYAAVLERQRLTPYFAESDLPASKDEVKQAILIVVAERIVADRMPASDLETYRHCYMLLINAKPASAVAQFNKIGEAVRRDPHPAPEVSRERVREFTSVLAVLREPPEEGERLLSEFTTRLDAMIASYVADTT